MNYQLGLESANAMQAAFRAQPEVVVATAFRTHLGVYNWQTPPMESFTLPATDDLVVALHLGGSRKVRAITDNGLSRLVSMPGLVTVLPPGRGAAFHTAGSISLVTLHVPRSFVVQQGGSSWLEQLQSTPSHFAFHDAYASASMEALLKVARRGAAPSMDYVGKLTDALLCHLSSHDSRLDSESSVDVSASRIGRLPFAALLAAIDTRIGSKLTIDELGAQTGLCRATFNRAFRQATGIPFHQYLMHRRIMHAKRMLRQTDFDLVYIAQELGFSNQSHFAAAFKSLQGCTPGKFRNGHDD